MNEEPTEAPRPTPGRFPGLSSLRTQLLVALGVAVVVPLLLVGVVVYVLAGFPTEGDLAAVTVGGIVIVTGLWLWLLDRWFHRRLLEPLDRMSASATRIAQGEHGHRIEPERTRELERLARAVNRMAGDLIQQQDLLAENVRSLKATNRALMEARDDLVHAEKLASVGRLAAGLAHEIGNPLNSILAYADVARRREADPEWVEGVRAEAERIDEIIAGLLDFARPKEGVREAVDLNAVVRDTHDLLESQGRIREVEVEVVLDDALPAADADRTRLQQVLVNLMLNACDALEEASDVPARISVRTTATRFERPRLEHFEPRREDDPETIDYSHLRRLQSPSLELRSPPFEEGELVVTASVADTGPGIEAEPIQRVFEPFFTTKEPGRGTGLGLAVSARLVQQMGGWIDARNREEGGSAFIVYLPRYEGEGDEQ